MEESGVAVADAINNAKAAVPVKVNALCDAIAKEVNKRLDSNVKLQADYEYWCGEFDPATDGKGWTAVTVCDPTFQELDVTMKFGIDGLSLTAEPLGVGVRLLVQGFVEYAASAVLEPQGLPERLQPLNAPSATSRVTMQLQVKATGAATITRFMALEPSGGITINKELAGPDGTGFPFEMVAEKKNCGEVTIIQ